MADVPKDLVDEIKKLEEHFTVDTAKLKSITEHFISELAKGISPILYILILANIKLGLTVEGGSIVSHIQYADRVITY
jgi:hypothetical protein